MPQAEEEPVWESSSWQSLEPAPAVNGLVNVLKFKQSLIDESVFYQGTTVLLIYMDNGILSGTSKKEIQTIIHQPGQLFNITDEGEIDA
jgi:hypothetical protein